MANDDGMIPPKRPRGRPRKERPAHLSAVPDPQPAQNTQGGPFPPLGERLDDGTDETTSEPMGRALGQETTETEGRKRLRDLTHLTEDAGGYDSKKPLEVNPASEFAKLNKGDELASMPTSGPEYDAAMQQAHPNYVKNREGKWVHPEDVYGKATLEAMEGRSPRQLKRQETIFQLSVIEGLSITQICERLGISKTTVLADIRAEESLRMQELEESRDAQLVRQLMLVQRGINESFKDRLNKGTGAYGAHTELLKQRSKLLGLDAAVKIDIGFSTILDAINVLPSEADQRAVFTKIVSPTGNTALPDSLTQAVREVVSERVTFEAEETNWRATKTPAETSSEPADEVSDTLEGIVTSDRINALTDLTTELQTMPPIETQPPADETGDAPFQEIFRETQEIEQERETFDGNRIVDANGKEWEKPTEPSITKQQVEAITARQTRADLENMRQVEANAEADAIRAGTIRPAQSEGVIIGEPVAIDAQAELLRGVKQAAEAQKLDGVAEAMGDHHSSIVGKSYTAERFGIDPSTGRPTANKATVVDTFAVKLSIDQAKAKQEAQAKAQSELATHTDNLPEAKALRKPVDAASVILTQGWFLAMPAQAQAEAVKAIRAQAAKDAETE